MYQAHACRQRGALDLGSENGDAVFDKKIRNTSQSKDTSMGVTPVSRGLGRTLPRDRGTGMGGQRPINFWLIGFANMTFYRGNLLLRNLGEGDRRIFS